MVERPGSIAIVGEELHFRDSSGERYIYHGEVTESVALTGNIGILGENLYYKDENGDVRKLENERVDEDVSFRRGIWISEKESLILYRDESGQQQAAHSALEQS